MLVLSRRLNEKIAFPSLGIAIQVVRVDGRIVRLGIDAPRDVPVLRAEIADDARTPFVAPPPARGEMSSKYRHDVLGRLNTATVALYVAQKHLEIGETKAAQEMLDQALGSLGSIERSLEPPAPPVSQPKRARALLVEDNVNESALLAKLSSAERDRRSYG